MRRDPLGSSTNLVVVILVLDGVPSAHEVISRSPWRAGADISSSEEFAPWDRGADTGGASRGETDSRKGGSSDDGTAPFPE